MTSNISSASALPISEPVIFLPGTMCDERIWLPLWQSMNLQQKAYVPLQWAESMPQMLALTQDRIDSFSTPVHLVGFSMGAYVACTSALQANNRNNIKSITLIAYNPNGLSSAETQSRMRLLKILNSKNKQSLGTSQLVQYYTQAELKDKWLLQPMLDMQDDLGSGVLKAHISATTPRDNLCNQLKKLNIYQHWISAQHDNIARPLAIKTFCNELPQAHYTELANTAHMSPLTKTKELAEILTTILHKH